MFIYYNDVMNYAPLYILSGYNFLSSSLKVEDIFKTCDKLSFPFFGICDINNMFSYGDIEKYKHSFKCQPIYGATIKYLVNEQSPLDISLYITNEEGYQNLIKIISLFSEGITLNELKSLTKGLIAITPTLSNQQIKNLLIDHDLTTLENELNKLKSIFIDFYLGIEIYTKNDIYLINLLREFSINNNYQTVCFNKHLYLTKQDAISLSILQAIKNDQKLSIKEEEGPYFFLGETALKKIYNESELNNTIIICSKCKDFIFKTKRGQLLTHQIDNKKEYIFNICINSLKQKNINDEKYIKRIKYELDIIEQMGYLDYFLIVKDYVEYAKNNSIPVGPGRGSSAGSLVSYLLNITEVDSIKYDLIFERFLNPKRISMPDIDIDFADYKRDDICKYIFNKYGNNKCANIITFQTLGARGSVRDIGRIFSINTNDIYTITNAIGRNPTLIDAYKNSDNFRLLMEDDYFLNIVKLAKKIEGLPRQSGLHAAGIIINNEELYKSLPIITNEDGSTITQFEAPLLEELGYLKMDILGLTNLTIIESMENYIKKYYDSSFTIKKISYQDEKTFNILNKGLTSGIFQLESPGITKSLKNVIMNDFNDIVAILALYRPGPMDNIPQYAKTKNEKLKINYIHNKLEKILSPTYGVIIYQEQIMQIAQEIAGFDLGQADLFRRAISKKDSQKLNDLKKDFLLGAKNNNIDEKTAEAVFNLIYKFANYGFNKSHSVSYALISYQMAYIKANYPSCFYACTLNHLSLIDPRMNDLSNELKYFNLTLHLPSITKSKKEFIIENNELYIPFTLIKGLNKNIVNNLIEIQKNIIDNFSTFIKYAEQYNIPDDAIINLINSGCFDEFNQTRTTLRKAMPILRLYYQNISNEENLTQEELSLLQPVIEEEKENEQLKYELEYNTLNILLSGSLLNSYKNQLEKLNIEPLNTSLLKNNTTIAGIIKKIRVFKTKKKEEMATLTLQDDTTSINVIVFNKTYKQYLSLLKQNNPIIIKGFFRQNEDPKPFISNEFIKLEVDK